MAWNCISAASNLCQTLGYHHRRKGVEDSLQAAQERLFWTVYKLDKALALRFGRSSNIRDADIMLPYEPNETRQRRLARLQGKVHEQLFSPASLSQLDDAERGRLAETLAEESRELINETHVEILV